jgi:CRP-like cAMP-binding protein
MYFIEKGDCVVKVKEKQKLRNADKLVRKLEESDHFGEITMMYRERRSATVLTSNYSTLGSIHID